MHRLRSTALVDALGQGRAAWWHDPRSGRYLLHTTRRGRLYHYTLRPAGLFLHPAARSALPGD